MRFRTALALAAALGLALVGNAQQRPVNYHILAPKITKEQAKRTALKAYAGKAVSNVQFEHFNDAWQYSIYIQQPHKLLDVIIDPQTGKILSARHVNNLPPTRKLSH